MFRATPPSADPLSKAALAASSRSEELDTKGEEELVDGRFIDEARVIMRGDRETEAASPKPESGRERQPAVDGSTRILLDTAALIAAVKASGKFTDIDATADADL